MIRFRKELDGRILDVGGGGEGIIGRLYTHQVTAIDNCQAELEEAPDGFKKILMDATRMDFPDQSFDHVTFFFTLMFMEENTQIKSILEAARVLKPGGMLHIWDCEILSAYPDPFCVDVQVQLPGECVCTTYGIVKSDTQTMDSIAQLCANAGLTLTAQQNNPDGFYLCFRKEA